MIGSVSQAAFFYQNNIAAFKVLELLDFGSSIKKIYLENYDKGKHIDDVIIEYPNFTRYYQIKWSLNDDVYTVHNLINPQSDKSKSLVQELAEGYASCDRKKDSEIILYSTKKAGNQKQPKKDINNSLNELINNIHIPFINSPTNQVSDLPKYPEYETTIIKIRNATTLSENEFDSFFKRLRFELSQPSIEQIKQNIYTKLELLGIDKRLYDTLLNSVVQWSITGEAITTELILKTLGIADRFVDGVAHNFKIEEEYYVENTSLFEQLDRAISTFNSGFILLEGYPGSGKSTALTMYQKQRENIVFAYYCFIPEQVTLGNPRLERDTFLKSLCIGIQKSFPDINFPQPYSEDYESKLRKYLYKLSEVGTKVVFIVDGLDHVDRKKEKLQAPLTNYIEGTLPDNIIFILSSQYPEAISFEIQAQIRQNILRHIKVGRFYQEEIKSFLQRRKISVSEREFVLIYEKSEGTPLYLYYIARLLLEATHYRYEEILQELPSLKNEKIDLYHSFLYEYISRNNLIVWFIAVLAQRKEYTTTSTIVELLTLLDISCDPNQLEEAVKTFKHLLKLSDSNSYAIFHNSFREFIIDKTRHLTDKINKALICYYQNHPSSDETYRNFYRHLFEMERYQKILDNCNDAWLKQSWESFRPFKEIDFNLDIAWESAIQTGVLREFVRIAFLKQEFGTITHNFDRADFQISKFLLNTGRYQDAIRSVWDGEKVNYSLFEFSQFVFDYYKHTKHLLPERIASLGLHRPTHGGSPEDLKKYYQALALYKDWFDLFDEVSRYNWHRKDEHNYTIEPENEEGKQQINNSIQEKIVEALFIAQKYESLLSIAQRQEISQEIRNLAVLYVIEFFLKAEEIEEAIGLFESLDLTLLGRQQYNHLIISLAEKGCLCRLEDKVTINYLPPTLFSNLTKEGIDGGIKDELLLLYDELRVHFLQNPSGHRIFLLTASTFSTPEQEFFLALVNLAQLWCDTVNNQLNKVNSTQKVKEVLNNLNINKDLRQQTLHQRINDPDYISREIHKIHAKVFDYITRFIPSNNKIAELVNYWLELDASPNGYKNHDIHIEFAKLVKIKNNINLEPAIKKLLARAELQAREDEETSVLVNELLLCAEAYGYCGFEDEAIRLWQELFALACGIYYRKDYQFNRAISVLRLAHKYHPEKSLERLRQVLTLAHQVKGTAQMRTIASAIARLIVFACEVSPDLALELLHREDSLIHRESAIQDLVQTLSKLENANLLYVWAIVKTMDKWDDFTDYTDPTMSHLFERVLELQEQNLAENIYSFARHQLLVENNRPGGVFKFAEKCMQHGMKIANAEEDFKDFREEREQEIADEERRRSLPERRCNVEVPEFQELQKLSETDFDKFSENVEQIRSLYIREERKETVDRAYQDLKKIFTAFYETLSINEQNQVKPHFFSIAKHYAKFKKGILELQISDGVEPRNHIQPLFNELLSSIASLTDKDALQQYIGNFFDQEQWLEKLVTGINNPGYWFERDVLTKIKRFIEHSSLKNIHNWETFCRQFLSRDELSRCLVALAKRLKKLKPDDCRNLLFEAWTEYRDFIYLDSSLIKELMICYLEVNQQEAKTVLLKSFYHQYKSYSQDLIYHIEQVIEFASYFDESEFYEYLYNQYERHNLRLAEGLSDKRVDYNWLNNYITPLIFEDSVVRYLVRLFDYPEVEIRRLALQSLYELVCYNKSLISHILEFSGSENKNIKEHTLSLVFSLAISNPNLILKHKDNLLEFLNESHFNIKQTAKEILLYCLDKGIKLEREEMNKIEATNRCPKLFFPILVEAGLPKGERFIPSSYQSNILHKLYVHQENDEVIDKVYARVIRLGWTSDRGMDEESATHRRHNINSNFDNIEINGGYFQAVQTALNEVFSQEIDSQAYDDDTIKKIKKYFRLYDPTDIFTKFEKNPKNISWLEPEISDEDFINFSDIDRRMNDFLKRDKDWITLYEDGNQRVDNSLLEKNQKTVYFRVIAFLVNDYSGFALKILAEDTRLRPYILLENQYRFEIPKAFCSNSTFPVLGIKPIIGISENNFRDQKNLSIASLLPDVLDELSLSRETSQSLNYFNSVDERVIQFIHWQDAFSHGRRRQKPNSSGVTLKIKREIFQSYYENCGYRLCFIVNLRRSIDKYCPEEDMNWGYFESILQA